MKPPSSPLKKLRKEKGTQAEISKNADLNPAHLRKIENGTVKRPRKTTLTKIATALGIDEKILQETYYPADGLPTEFKFMDEIGETEVPQPRTIEGMIICKLLLSGKVHARTEKKIYKILADKNYT
jgi:transcriptional regulator with XRE-family HTH domain